MPFVDKYDTQSPIALVRQLMDYKLMNDRNSLDEKIFIQDCIFFGCMNPKSGSFFINPRLQRWFTTISLLAPDNEYLKKIFGQILESHLTKNGFGDQILKYMDKVVTVTCELFNKVTSNTQFSPTAKKFHYLFNLREISRIFEGLLLSDVK
jgi:dynein heavy chain